MPRQLILFISALFILFLFVRDRRLRPMTSGALWITLLWVLIIGTKPVSLWLGSGVQVETPEDYLEGSPVDRNILLFLIIAGLAVLVRRRVDWGKIFTSNSWLFAFFIYCGVSVVWSDYPFIAFKRWIKDIGNVVMIMILVTEADPAQAFKAVFARYTNVAIPLSVVLIKYFPDIGRYYNRWTWQPAFSGVTMEKNTLGAIAVICGLFLVWDLIEMKRNSMRKTGTLDVFNRVILLIMVIWLVGMAHSSTSTVCLIMGTGILLFMRLPIAKRQVRHMGKYSLVLGCLIYLLYAIPGAREAFVEMVGRDMTFTGRTDLWADLLSQPINPIIGTGYQSFWLGPFAEHMWMLYYFHPNQAHNGFLETYLNGGLVGVFLLMAMIVSAGSKIKHELLVENSYGILRFSFFFIVLFSNWTEATFNKLTPVWIILIIASLTYPRSAKTVPENMTKNANNNFTRSVPTSIPRAPVLPRHFAKMSGVNE